MAPNFLEIMIPAFKRAARLSAAQRPLLQKITNPRHSFTTSGHSRGNSGSSGSSGNTFPSHEHPTRPVAHLNNKVAIVTGAGCHGSQDDLGNGSATAILLAEAGATVLCVDRDLSFAERTAALINRNNNNVNFPGQASLAVAVKADVTDPVDCKNVTDHALSRFGRLDILVNVVGVMGARGTAPDLDLDGWDAGLRINVTSMMLMARYAVPAMLRNERTAERPVRGSIVNVGSVAGLRGGTPHLLYPTSKGAVVNMTRAMAAHHGKDGVRVNCVCPGMLYTPMMYRNGMSDEMREKRRQRSLLQTEGNVWDFAHAVRFLASDEARWITGAILPVDAGATAATSLSP